LVLAPLGLICSGLGIWFSVVTIREYREYAEPGDFVVRVTACDRDGRVLTAGGTIENQSSRTRSYQILVDFDDGVGRRGLVQAEARVDDVDAGETVEWSAIRVAGFTDDTAPLSCRVADVSGPDPFS
jgi:hypothetical protein